MQRVTRKITVEIATKDGMYTRRSNSRGIKRLVTKLDAGGAWRALGWIWRLPVEQHLL